MKLPVCKYQAFRQNIQTGDILACMGSSKLSKGIQWTENKKDKNQMVFLGDNGKNIKGFFSHVGVFVRVLDQIFIVEANGKMVAFTRFSRTYHKYKGHLFIIRPHICNETIFMPNKVFADYCLEVEGAKYDWKGIWKQLVNCFSDEAIKHKEDKELFCSELLNMASGYYWEDKDKWCTPHDIALKERDHFLVRIIEV